MGPTEFIAATLAIASGTLAGALADTMGTSTGIGAAPLALLYQHQPRDRICLAWIRK